MSRAWLLGVCLASLFALGRAIGSTAASSSSDILRAPHFGSSPLEPAAASGAAARLVRRESPAGFRDGGAFGSPPLPPEEGVSTGDYPVGGESGGASDGGSDSSEQQQLPDAASKMPPDEIDDAEDISVQGGLNSNTSQEPEFEVVNKSSIAVGPFTSLDHPNATCEDNLVTGISFHSGQEASCLELVSYCNDSYFGDRVTSQCKRTCGLCDIVVDAAEDDVYCMDAMPSDPPIFMMHEKMTDCRDLRAFCDTDADVRWKCRASCGVCLTNDTSASQINDTAIAAVASNSTIVIEASNASNATTTKWVVPTPPGPTSTTTTEAPDLLADQVMGCSRRRFMGFCATRRRGI